MFVLKVQVKRIIGKEGIYDVISFDNTFSRRTTEDATYDYIYKLEQYAPSAQSDFDVYSAKFAKPIGDIDIGDDFPSIEDLIAESDENPLYMYYANDVSPIGTNNAIFDPSQYADYDAMETDYVDQLGFISDDISNVITGGYSYIIIPVGSESLLKMYKIVEFKYKDTTEELYVGASTMLSVDNAIVTEQTKLLSDIKVYDTYHQDEEGKDVKIQTRPQAIYDGKQYLLNDINYFFEGVSIDLDNIYDLYNGIELQSINSTEESEYEYNLIINLVNRFLYVKNMLELN